MKKYILISITGKGGHGKTSLADCLSKSLPYSIRESFARPMKAMMEAFTDSLAWLDEPDKVDLANKYKPQYLLGGRTLREVYQTLGTEWGRNLINQDLWLRHWHERFKSHLHRKGGEDPVIILVDDCRFANEWKLLDALGAIHIHVVRYNDVPRGDWTAHDSEQLQFLDPWRKPPFHIRNDKTLDDLYIEGHRLGFFLAHLIDKGTLQCLPSSPALLSSPLPTDTAESSTPKK